MQNSGGEGGDGDGDGSHSQNVGGVEQDDGGRDNTLGNDGMSMSHPQEPGPEASVLDDEPNLDQSSVEELSTAAIHLGEGSVSHNYLTPYHSNTPEDEQDLELLMERNEDELVVLSAEHPLTRRYQSMFKSQISRHLERVEKDLNEMREMDKTDASQMQEIGIEISRIQEQLAKFQNKVQEYEESESQAETKYHQIQEQLEAKRFKYSGIINQKNEAEKNYSLLLEEFDNVMQKIVFTQARSEDLRSNVKVMMNSTRKAGVEKTKAEDQKVKQDMYVELLTKNMERLTQQIAMYDVQICAQAQETEAAKEALSETEMEWESLLMARKQLLQQWNSSLLEMRRRDEAFSAMQEAKRVAEHQLTLQDREIEGYKRSSTVEQEKNENLSIQWNLIQMECGTTKKLVNQKLGQQEALKAQLSTCLRSLQETEQVYNRLTKDIKSLEAEIIEKRRQVEKESTIRLELEDSIITQTQQQLTHNMAAKYSVRCTSKMVPLKKEKVSLLWQLEREIAGLKMEDNLIRQNLQSLAQTEEEQDKDIINYNKSIANSQAEFSSFASLIEQKQNSINTYNKRIAQIIASTGHEDRSPLQVKSEGLKTQLDDLMAKIKSDQQLWLKQQVTLVGLAKEIQVSNKNINKLQVEYTSWRQRKIRLESQAHVEHREEAELDKDMKVIKDDLLKLNTQLSKNRQLSHALEQENTLMETEFIQRLKEAEREFISMQMRLEKIQEDKEMLLNNLVEAERHIMLWDKKIQLIKETISIVEMDDRQGELQSMKSQINRMEYRLNQLIKQQERLQRESVATVVRRESTHMREEAILHGSHKESTKGQLSRINQSIRRKIKQSHKDVGESEQVFSELQKRQASVNDQLTEAKEKVMQLRSISLECNIENIQDTKDKFLLHLLGLQTHNKKLQAVCQGNYQTLSTNEAVDAILQNQLERVHAMAAIIHHLCAEFPQQQGDFRQPLLSLEVHKQEQETFSGGRGNIQSPEALEKCDDDDDDDEKA